VDRERARDEIRLGMRLGLLALGVFAASFLFAIAYIA